jgi:protein-disulfide isomerase
VQHDKREEWLMTRWSRTMRYLGLAVALCLPVAARAQFTSQAPVGVLKNLSLLKPPSDSKVAIVVFEDLGCPHCAMAHPIELQAAAQTHGPIERYDLPIPGHVWTYEGAVCARYIQDRVSPQLANQFRTDLFAAQMSISNQEDVLQFTRSWLQHHGKQMPFVIDPDGSLAKQIDADIELGRRLNVNWTPTIVVVTDHKQQVICGANAQGGDPKEIVPVVEAALAQVQSQPHAIKHTEATH